MGTQVFNIYVVKDKWALCNFKCIPRPLTANMKLFCDRSDMYCDENE